MSIWKSWLGSARRANDLLCSSRRMEDGGMIIKVLKNVFHNAAAEEHLAQHYQKTSKVFEDIQTIGRIDYANLLKRLSMPTHTNRGQSFIENVL
jgi:hypothetical protein